MDIEIGLAEPAEYTTENRETIAGHESVGSLGLGGSLISFAAVDPGPTGGNLAARVLSDPTARRAVDDLLSEQKQVVVDLLSDNRYLVEALRDVLVERHGLVGREIVEVLDTARAETDATVDLTRMGPADR